MKIAILGYGVVGSGVAEILRTNREILSKKTGQAIEVKYVLDLRDFPGDPLESRVIKDFSVIENDPEVSVVVESIGGETVAYEFAKRALLAGKSVCTPNKATVAAHGAELFEIAREKGVNLLFEASVGGGIPLIRPFHDALLADEVQSVAGILNGTSNYILTQMSVHGESYETALKSAQELGYAEQDPTADVGGYDAARKLAIMLSLAAGKVVDYKKITTEGIENIGKADFAFAAALGFTLKQIVEGRISPCGIEAIAAPFLVPLSHPMSIVNDVYNAVWIQSKATGSTMFYGSGAGKLPTASAVVSNIVDVALGNFAPQTWSAKEAEILPLTEYKKRRVIRFTCENPTYFVNNFDAEAVVSLPDYPNQVAILTAPLTEAEMKKTVTDLENLSGVKVIERVLRVYD